MRIEFSEHAKERLKVRKISKLKVLEVINNPERTVRSFRSRKLIQRRYGGKILEVITKVENKKIVVVTAYYLIDKNEIKIRQKN